MPLHRGTSKEVIQKNIDEMIAAGHDPKQAVAAAYAKAREEKKMSEGGEVGESVEQENSTPIPDDDEKNMELILKALKERR